MNLKDRVDVATGRKPADLVLTGGRIVNVLSCEIHEGDVAIVGDRIVGLGRYEGRETVDVKGRFICPGFLDAHVHIESSMLWVREYARVVSAHGTAAVVTDPHEIANVLGVRGIRYMLDAGRGCPIDVYAMASSCVPASPYESSGAALSAEDVGNLMEEPDVLGLAEMMNYPGVIAGDEQCLRKIALAGARVVDGHAPGLSGRELCAYVACGIRSDHECTNLEEAREKLRLGLHIMIREGSQARNLEALVPLVQPDTLSRFLFCTDDKDVDDLLSEGHMDHIIRRAAAKGLAPIHAYAIATINAARYFGLHDLGAVAPGRLASLAIVDDLETCRVWRTYHRGRLVAEEGRFVGPEQEWHEPPALTSSVCLHDLRPEELVICAQGNDPCRVRVIEAIEDRIDTNWAMETLAPLNGDLHADPSRDICKLAVVERHRASGNVAVGFVRGFGLQRGAIGSTVGHDAHNLILAGVHDEDMVTAARHLQSIGGGFCAVAGGKVLADVPLPIAGLMSRENADTLSGQLRRLHEATRSLGGRLRTPFMLLSFLPLSVIGRLKLTDQGLVDADGFRLVDVVVGPATAQAG